MTDGNRARLGGLARLVAMGGLGLAISACSMGSMFGGGANGAQQTANASASVDQIAQAPANALPAIATECPPIKVRPGAEALFKYANGQVGNPRGLHYQAVLDRESRNCIVSNGLITVNMGVVGRLLLGPAGTEQSVTLPLRFAVERDDVAVFTQKYDIPVTIAPSAQSAEFTRVVENVAIPYLGGETVTIWVGFDPRG